MSTTTLHQTRARAEYALNKYLQLCHGKPHLLTEDTALTGSLRDCIEFSAVRLGVYGIFLVFNDAEKLHFIAGGRRRDTGGQAISAGFEFGTCDWLRLKEQDQSTWASIVQEIITHDASDMNSGNERVFSIPNLKRNPRTATLSAVTGPTNLKFLAGVPLTSQCGHNIGALCVSDRVKRPPLSQAESAIMTDAARRFMGLLDLARERDSYSRQTALQEELNTFLQSVSLHAQLLEDVRTPVKFKSSEEGHTVNDTKESNAEKPLSKLSGPTAEREESERMVGAELERDYRILAHDNGNDAPSLTARRDRDDERGSPRGETIYRKVFRKAAECLKYALEADGVLFVDGLVELHGEVQPVAEPEQELYREIASQSERQKEPTKEDKPGRPGDAHDTDRSELSGTHRRVYTSAEYMRSVYVQKPTEILEVSGSCEELGLKQIAESTFGLPEVNEGFLQRLMDRHPDGAIWYATSSGFMLVKNDTLVEIDLKEEANRLTTVFKNVKQLIFKPLTDRTSRKRLGACIAWRLKPTPVFTDTVDLRATNAFMHVVECEIARCDASHIAKQKETFVSSVSHELRTPLHGVLGAVQLLTESGLDPMQKSLADIIMTSGSTLHETLTSVLSYAKINQFERRQHEYRQRQPPDTVWALTDKEGFASGPDRDYEDLYICSNLAILCEEILGVLEAGKSFHGHHAGEVIVVCNIEHQEHWIYHTEPGAFRRIAVNLIGNALKYTKSGSLLVTLSTAPMINDSHRVSSDLTSGHTLTLTIEDTGRGMSKEFMDNQLFIPFSQEDPTSTHGVGLGMSIVKSLVSLLSGEIEVRSEEGKGTKISVNVPMRLCTPDDCDKGEATAEFDHDVETIRERKISAVIYGFPQYVRESLTNYLCDWFNCTLLEPTKDARPDIVLVDEGNEDIMDAVNGTAKEYGERGVLLSIVMVPSRIGKKMHTIDGYIKWERIPRPLGPSNVARSLLSCLEKMDELRKHDKNAKVDTPEPEMGSQAGKDSASLKELTGDLTSDEHMPDLEKLEIAEAPQNSSPPPENVMPPDSSGPVLREKQTDAAKEAVSNSKDPKAVESSGSLLDLRILVVDDNHLNLKLLATFFKKRGYRNVSQVTDGIQAVEEVKKTDHGVDMIFMDLSMPVMDGFEATRQIRKMESEPDRVSTTKDSVIIALTGLASQNDEDAAFDAGVDLFITKPVQFPKLSILLQQYEQGILRRRGQPL